jgi:NitT/TauT family transport system substrate-binding protein
MVRSVRWLFGSGRETVVRACAAVVAAVVCAGPALALDKVTFGTNWLADAEAGGYYQALVDGTYAKYGLDVTILQGGPQSNGGMLLVAGKIEFFMGGDMIGDFLSVEQGVPTIAVAANFQKNPQIFMSHPGVGLDKWTDLPNAATVFASNGALNTFYAWMRLAHGFSDENVKPYNYNSAPFIADKHSIQQGYLTAEPFEVQQQGGFKPNIFLLSDYGYSTYSTLIETRRDLVAKRPDLVQRFVDASAIGWYHYLYGDNKKANELIKKENPEMSDEQLAFSIAKLKEYGVVDSGDSIKLGIGAMTDERWRAFFDTMVKVGIVKADTDYKKAYTLQFVNKGVGVDLRPK